MCKNPEQRLGSKDGINEIKSHKWLSSIDFESIRARKLEAPLDPLTYILKQELSPYKDNIEGYKQGDNKHSHLMFFDYNCEKSDSLTAIKNIPSQDIQRRSSFLNLTQGTSDSHEKTRARSGDHKNVVVEKNLLTKPFKVSAEPELSASLNGSQNCINMENHSIEKLNSLNSLGGSLTGELSNHELESGELNSANSIDIERSSQKINISKSNVNDLSNKKSKVWMA